MELKKTKYLIVGAGFFGAVIAERIANDKNELVVVIDKRDHIGGNSYSKIDDETGIEYHKYGSHIFHTSNEKVWRYINRFCTFNNYRHKVLTTYRNKVYQMPINLDTINSFYGMNLKPFEAKEFLRSEIEKEKIEIPSNFEEKAISLMGRRLYEAFIKGYTIKQWGIDPKLLPSNIITRLPVRYDYNNYYFDDPWQGIPLEGYGSLFEKILKHKNIKVYLNTDFFTIRNLLSPNCCIVYTGPIDCFFDYKFGKLGWRTLSFEKEILSVDNFQGTTVMNYAESSIPFTRIHEFKHFHVERRYTQEKTIIFREYSKNLGPMDDPYYPINTERDKKIFEKYYEESKKIKNIIFGGRLGTYKYLDMDKAIESALKTYDEKIKNYPEKKL
jgi:UDP-galactopyranose mutase